MTGHVEEQKGNFLWRINDSLRWDFSFCARDAYERQSARFLEDPRFLEVRGHWSSARKIRTPTPCFCVHLLSRRSINVVRTRITDFKSSKTRNRGKGAPYWFVFRFERNAFKIGNHSHEQKLGAGESFVDPKGIVITLSLAWCMLHRWIVK